MTFSPSGSTAINDTTPARVGTDTMADGAAGATIYGRNTGSSTAYFGGLDDLTAGQAMSVLAAGTFTIAVQPSTPLYFLCDTGESTTIEWTQIG